MSIMEDSTTSAWKMNGMGEVLWIMECWWMLILCRWVLGLEPRIIYRDIITHENHCQNILLLNPTLNARINIIATSLFPRFSRFSFLISSFFFSCRTYTWVCVFMRENQLHSKNTYGIKASVSCKPVSFFPERRSEIFDARVNTRSKLALFFFFFFFGKAAWICYTSNLIRSLFIYMILTYHAYFTFLMNMSC